MSITTISSFRKEKGRWLIYGAGSFIASVVAFWYLFSQSEEQKSVFNGLDLGGAIVGTAFVGISLFSFYSASKISRTYPVMVALLRGEKETLAYLFDLEMDGMAVLSLLEQEKHYLLQKYLDYVLLRYSKGVRELKSLPVAGEDEYSEPYPSRVIGIARQLQKIEGLPSYRRGKQKARINTGSSTEGWWLPFQIAYQYITLGRPKAESGSEQKQ